MKRYTAVLERAYSELVDLTLIRPPEPISRRWRWGGLKWVGYVEKFVFLWPLLWWRVSRADLVHIADHSDAIWALGIRRTPVVVTCHDLIAVRAALGELPEHRPGRSGRLYQALVLRGLARASRVVSVSVNTARDVERLTGHAPLVLWNPLDEHTYFTDHEPPAADRPHNYLLVVSTRGWRKRRIAAVEAWADLRQTQRFRDCSLIVLGDPLDTEEVQAIQRCGAVDGAVTQLAGVSDHELADLYAHARALLQLSKYEGFGWPIIEAQAHGVPVLATDAELFREVAGRHACFLNDAELADRSVAHWERVAEALGAVDVESARTAVNRFSWNGFPERLIAAATGRAAHLTPTMDLTGPTRKALA